MKKKNTVCTRLIDSNRFLRCKARPGSHSLNHSVIYSCTHSYLTLRGNYEALSQVDSEQDYFSSAVLLKSVWCFASMTL